LLFALQQQSISKQSQTFSHRQGVVMSNQMPIVASVAAWQGISVCCTTCIHFWAASSNQQTSASQTQLPSVHCIALSVHAAIFPLIAIHAVP